MTAIALPDRIADVEALDELLSRPSQAVIDDLAALATQAGYAEFTWYEARKPSAAGLPASVGRTT